MVAPRTRLTFLLTLDQPSILIMSQPRISIPKTQFDYTLIAIGLAGVLAMIGLTAIYFEQLPDQIPTHFDASGQPDSYGDKSTLWFLVIVGIAVYGLILLVNRTPHLVNYSVPITPENAARQYQNLQRMNRTMAAVISLCLAYILYGIIEMSLGDRDSLGLWFMLLFLGLIFGVVGYYLYRAKVIE